MRNLQEELFEINNNYESLEKNYSEICVFKEQFQRKCKLLEEENKFLKENIFDNEELKNENESLLKTNLLVQEELKETRKFYNWSLNEKKNVEEKFEDFKNNNEKNIIELKQIISDKEKTYERIFVNKF